MKHGVGLVDGPGRREAAGHQRQTQISTLVTPNSHGSRRQQGSEGVVSLAVSDIGERCEGEGIWEDDHDSEHVLLIS